MRPTAENTLGVRITVHMVSSLTRLDLTEKENMYVAKQLKIKTCKTGDEQLYSDTSPNGERSLP